MSFVQCVGAGTMHMYKSLKRIILMEYDDVEYFSKIGKRNLLFQNRGKISLYYHRRLPSDSLVCELSAMDLVMRCISFMLTILLIYVAFNRLVASFESIIWRTRRKNESQLMDEEEVELYTIDSIEEFEKMSKTETSTEILDDLREDETKRKILYQQKGQELTETETDECDPVGSDGSYTLNQKELHYHHEKGDSTNIYSVIAEPLNSIKNMLSHFTPNYSERSNSTDDEKVNFCSKRQLSKEPNPEKDRKVRNRDQKVSSTKRAYSKQASRKMKDRSMNTEIKTYKMNDMVSFQSAKAYTDNETDLEKEMVLIDIPANYYYQNHLLDKHEPCLIKPNKQRHRNERLKC